MNEAKRLYDVARGYVNREWERITGDDRISAEEELYQEDGARKSTPSPVEVLNPDEKARRILGVSESASFDEIKEKHDQLVSRASPANFVDGSVEARHAAEIQDKVRWAFRHLSEKFDTTERRFRSLEID
jgi:DnaJ-domain-containing protein 1